MAAPKGHPLWGNPLNHKKLTPTELWDGAIDYFKWCDENPWHKEDFIKSGEMAGSIVKLKTQRPYTIEGLCIHLNISYQTFFNYSKEAGYETYFDICTHIRKVIDNQHFEGGMVGAFNANIVTRKLGLTEKTELTGKDGVPLIPVTGIEIK